MRTKQPPPIPTRDALKQLAAESRSSAEQYADAAPAVRKVRERYEREISSLPEVKTHLDKLEDRGVKPERVLKCLVAFVLLEKHGTWQAKAAEKKANLRNLAKRLLSVSGKVKEAYGADANRPDLFAMSLGLPVLPASPYDPGKAVKYMLETAADLETKARGFGRLRKDLIPLVERDPIVKLLRVLNPKPWRTPEFPPKLRQQLAELLDAVCESYGIKESFTADRLFKTFKRHVLRPSK